MLLWCSFPQCPSWWAEKASMVVIINIYIIIIPFAVWQFAALIPIIPFITTVVVDFYVGGWWYASITILFLGCLPGVRIRRALCLYTVAIEWGMGIIRAACPRAGLFFIEKCIIRVHIYWVQRLRVGAGITHASEPTDSLPLPAQSQAKRFILLIVV